MHYEDYLVHHKTTNYRTISTIKLYRLQKIFVIVEPHLGSPLKFLHCLVVLGIGVQDEAGDVSTRRVLVVLPVLLVLAH